MAGSGSPSKDQVREWRAQRLLIEKDEPTQIAALNIRCHNEEAEARDYGNDQIYKIRWYQVALSHILTLPPNRFDPKG